MGIDFLGRTLVPTHHDLEGAEGERQGTLTVLIGSDIGAVYVLTAPSSVLGRSERAEVVLLDIDCLIGNDLRSISPSSKTMLNHAAA